MFMLLLFYSCSCNLLYYLKYLYWLKRYSFNFMIYHLPYSSMPSTQIYLRSNIEREKSTHFWKQLLIMWHIRCSYHLQLIPRHQVPSSNLIRSVDYGYHTSSYFSLYILLLDRVGNRVIPALRSSLRDLATCYFLFPLCLSGTGYPPRILALLLGLQSQRHWLLLPSLKLHFRRLPKRQYLVHDQPNSQNSPKPSKASFHTRRMFSRELGTSIVPYDLRFYIPLEVDMILTNMKPVWRSESIWMGPRIWP